MDDHDPTVAAANSGKRYKKETLFTGNCIENDLRTIDITCRISKRLQPNHHSVLPI